MYSKVILVVAACVVATCHGAGHSSTSVDNQNGGKFGYKVSHEYIPKEGPTRYYDEGASGAPAPVRGVPYYAGSTGESDAKAYHHPHHHYQQQPQQQQQFRSAGQGTGEVAYYAKAPFEGAGVQAIPLSGGPSGSYGGDAGNFRQY